ncbi:hypothetical protein OERS_38780 [Oerskovia enterophila]|uniref:Uncharacterized protein n=1 Tax=Oerskovia enterophila TaxID=43678 RepID=A0ABX2XZW5_9CELL|nr:hypothetical protein OERS_38780 [Oerskovia enterophila]
MRSPSATTAPSATATLTIVPCMGEASVVPLLEPALAVERRAGRRAALAERARPAAMPRPAGSTTSRRLPPTSTTTRSVAGASSSSVGDWAGVAGASLVSSSANVVSIQRVCTRNAEPSVGTKSSESSTARWNGTTVGMPSTTISRSVRRARWTASRRVAPVTMTLAIIESNAPEMTSPSLTPLSTRTPGPLGKCRREMRPGAGRKFAAGSSPLMRNSSECPRVATWV